ncbi:MAG: HD domain-containing protein [Planctomycetes bacterium]|nr:HD domain-containing protein [Planctomycetota bacterium]
MICWKLKGQLMVRCPGQDQRFWKPEDIFEVKCPGCGGNVEFFKDEPKLKCRKCGLLVTNPKIDLGCAEWCQYAEQCLGVSPEGELNIIADKLKDEMKEVFAGDQKRIEHALSVLNYSEQIREAEGGDPLVVKAAAILHDIGIVEAERKYDSSAGKYQELEGPPLAEGILKRYDLKAETIEHICRIIANHHSAKDIDTAEFRIVWDADWLVNIPTDFPEASKEKLQEIIDKTFKTCKGRQIALEIFLNRPMKEC